MTFFILIVLFPLLNLLLAEYWIWYPAIFVFFFHLIVNASLFAFTDVIVVDGIFVAKTVVVNASDITNSKFKKGNKTIKIKKAKTVSKKITGLKPSKKYYVRIRTYKIVNKKTYYSNWSKKKCVTTKSSTPISAATTTTQTHCTNNNNHSTSCGNIGKWFNTKDEIEEYRNNISNKYCQQYENGEITWEEYMKKSPYGYECWSCGYCGKWTGSFKYR